MNMVKYLIGANRRLKTCSLEKTYKALVQPYFNPVLLELLLLEPARVSEF